MGIRITTDDFGVKVWRSDTGKYPDYSVNVSKLIDGSWVSVRQPVRFRKGIELENGAEIIIDDGFATVDAWKDRAGEIHKRQVWMIMDFHYCHQQKPVRKSIPAQESFNMPDSFAAAEDEIPFKP